MKQNKKLLVMLGSTVLSSATMAIALQVFVRPAKILSSGFTGIAILTNMLGEQNGINIPLGVMLIALNLPVAYFCYKKISWRFTLFSVLQIILTSILVEVIQIEPVFSDEILCVVFGGFLNGFGISLALKGNLSTGGTDFIALYVSNRWGKEIWKYVFGFNVCLIIVFGTIFGFRLAGYSILYQFISTKIIETSYTRYKRVLVQIFTKRPDDIIDQYVKWCRHGITRIDGKGGYSKEPVSMLTTVTSVYEVDDTIDLIKSIDPHVIINVTKSERFVGTFYNIPLE